MPPPMDTRDQMMETSNLGGGDEAESSEKCGLKACQDKEQSRKRSRPKASSRRQSNETSVVAESSETEKKCGQPQEDMARRESPVEIGRKCAQSKMKLTEE